MFAVIVYNKYNFQHQLSIERNNFEGIEYTNDNILNDFSTIHAKYSSSLRKVNKLYQIFT